MRFFIVSIVLIIVSGLAFGWLIVYHPYIAECLIISLVCMVLFVLIGSWFYSMLTEK